ncbi:7-carboxy-7-deazaguanine synthase QueE [Saccharibacillus sp. CPCC 101409]|uniref:7-carboxy-7-deazaguanine synthase QueE n=1 Tax=Saccharibacillus sp. CPCC 101409 TaxID=3058041 RepID=UPI00267106CF|nr:7-carboxy-7-deazaguanine synthase QueE [Saccharibacillus sp. CPCC 101409]MDO3408511.1 7-carboxy-7-deazaguanine synthase QueE [Saccharibacillus sp. CPCC 101409]
MNQTSPAVRPIPVLEIFGPTIQGEGMSIGRKTMFVRTAGCDYRCSWCDSKFTWDGSAKDQIRMLAPAEILDELLALGGDTFDHVTISGGNPLLLPQLGDLVQLLRQRGIRTAVETQGSRWQDWIVRIDEVTLSPKPPSSGMETDFDVLDSIVERLREAPGRREMCIKIVIFDEDDLTYARGVHARYPDVPFILQTGNPEVSGEVRDHVSSLLSRYEWLIGRLSELPDLKDARALPQLHTLVWGNKRGV